VIARCVSAFILCGVLVFGAIRDESIHRMVVGTRAFEVSNVVDLTTRADGYVCYAWTSPDGKYVAVRIADDPEKSDARRLVLVRSSGGKPVTLFAVSDEQDEGKFSSPGEYVQPSPDENRGVAWSPDSKLIAFPAERVVVGREGESSFVSIIVVTPLGVRRATFDLPKDFGPEGQIVWSRDSRRLACPVHTWVYSPAGDSKFKPGILVCDVLRGVGEELVAQESGSVYPVSWSDDGASLMYASRVEERRVQLREVRLRGEGDTLIQDDYHADGLSPDRKLRVTTDNGLQVENLITRETTTVLKEFKWTLPTWSPDSRMLVYQRPGELWDENHRRSEQTASIWLALPQSGLRNHMCVVSDADPDVSPSFSADCLRMAYISQGRLRLAELVWRDLTVDEKLAAGIPLTEQEEKDKMLENAKKIAAALAMYNGDWDGRLPFGDTVTDMLSPYLRAFRAESFQNPFFRPGTEDMIFQYNEFPSLASIQFPATTIIGVLDSGFSWRVIIYADGHVIIQPK